MLLAVSVIHCGGGALPAPTVAPKPEPIPQPVATTAAVPVDPFAMPTKLREDLATSESLREPDLGKWAAVKKLSGIGPATCPAVARVPTMGKKITCEKPAIEAVDAALKAGDGALAELELCPAFPAGYIRSLRAEVAKPECADLYVDDLIEHPKQGTPAPLMQVMVGQSVAAKLLRTGLDVPSIKGIHEKDKLLAYYNKTLGPWFKAQQATIDQLSQVAVSLRGYGMAVAATEAGYAELRLVDTLRNGTTPKDWDADLKHAYESALEDAMAPMKAKGRDATLVGFGIMASLDLPYSPRIARARNLLATMYGGRRIDALDALMFATGKPGETDVKRASAAYHLRTLVPPPKEPDARAPLGERLRAAERHLARGTTFWRAVDYDRVLVLVGPDMATDDTARLYGALALALRQGPVDANHFMNAAAPSDLNLTHTDALDQLSHEKRSTSGMAAFDAAVLREIAPPPNAQREHFTDVGKRFDYAAQLLEGAPQSAARTRAEGARALAAAIK